MWLFLNLVLAIGAVDILGQDDVISKPQSPREPLVVNHPCDNSSCFPASGNLMIGRESQLKATSNCGSDDSRQFCIVERSGRRNLCLSCRNLGIHNIVDRLSPNQEAITWWQSQNGIENVTIQLNFEAEFYLSYVLLSFETFRPAAMFIEKSLDFERSWVVHRYFAEDCEKSFPGVPKFSSATKTEVVCDSRYSSMNPSSGGEVIFTVLPWSMKVDDPYSNEIQSLLKVTNLRVTFVKFHDLKAKYGKSLANDKEYYYYAVSEMIVKGSCLCYGHASRCLPLLGRGNVTDMVYGRCDCFHNTKGLNCEQCQDSHNDLPWRPTLGNATNACRPCDCNHHSESCHFDQAVYELSGRTSGGVCDDCQHNTMGKNCELCRPFYYKDPSLDSKHPEVCKACDCDLRGSLDDGVCDSQPDLEAGSCRCKANVEGRRCDSCKEGFDDLQESDPDGCQPVDCNPRGTMENDIFDLSRRGGGPCRCKENVEGSRCDRCKRGFWRLEDGNPRGCSRCPCNPFGVAECNMRSGKCRCKKYVKGERCDVLTFSFGD